MLNPPADKRHFYDGFLSHVMTLFARRSTVFCTLLLALTLSGTVPQGFMRSAADNGMMLVLCTSNGPTEVWMSADGEIHQTAPIDHSPPDLPDCLAVTLSLVMVQAWFDTLVSPAEFVPFHVALSDQLRALVVTHSPLQPRAPPTFV